MISNYLKEYFKEKNISQYDVEEHYEEVIKHREQEIQDNYKQISPSEMYGI